MYLCRHQLTNLQVGFLVSWLQLRFRHLVLTHDPVLVVPGHFSHRLEHILNMDMWTQYHLLWHIYLATLTLSPLEIHSTLAHSPLVRPLWFVRYFISSNSVQFVICQQFVRYPGTINSWETYVICDISQHTLALWDILAYSSLWNVCDLWDLLVYSPLVIQLWFVQYLSTLTPCYTSVICEISQQTHPLWDVCDLWDIRVHSPLCDTSVICEVSRHTHPLLYICDLWDIRVHSPLVRRLWFAALGWVLPLWSWQLNTPTQGEVSPGQSSCGQGRFVREGARDPPPPQLCPSGNQPHRGSVHT